MSSAARIEVFFDGECPLCVREIRMIERFDRAGRLAFTDIAAPGFDAIGRTGRSFDTLMGSLHARLADGRFISGVEVFRQMYSAIGLGPLVRLTRLPGISHGLRAGYRWFARNRLWLTRRSVSTACANGRCALPDPSQEGTSGLA